jgi:hypothetical protein
MQLWLHLCLCAHAVAHFAVPLSLPACCSTDPKAPGSKLNMKSVKLVYNGDLARAIEDWAATQAASRRASQQGQLAMLEQRLASIRMRAQATLFQQQQQQQQGNEQQQGQQAPQPAQASYHLSVPQPRQQQQQNGEAGPSNANPFRAAGVPAAAAAGAAAGDAGVGGSASGALRMMRTSSAALAQVASMVSRAFWLVSLLLRCWCR